MSDPSAWTSTRRTSAAARPRSSVSGQPSAASFALSPAAGRGARFFGLNLPPQLRLLPVVPLFKREVLLARQLAVLPVAVNPAF